MELLPMSKLLAKAHGNYAVAAINCCNLENIRDVLETAEELNSPIIIQAAPREALYANPKAFTEVVKAIGANKSIRVAIHLDHGDSFEIAAKCVQGGFTSVMFDGSLLSFEDNIRISRQVTELAHCTGISSEVELGTIGQTTEMGERVEKDYMTDPDLAKEFVEKTNPDCLAVAIGNAHGLYKFTPNLDFDRLQSIQSRVSVPLVLHGGTGLPAEQIRRAIRMGVAKVNFSTVTRVAWIKAVKKYLADNPEDLMTMNIIGAGSLAFKQTVRDCIGMVGSANRL